MPPRGEDGYEVALLDWLSCAAAGTAEPAARAARAVGDGLVERVAAAGAAGHVLDFDDTYLPGVAHLSAATAPAALLVAAERGSTPAPCSTPSRPGSRRWARWRGPAHPALYDGGWHPTAVCGRAGRGGGGGAAARPRREAGALGGCAGAAARGGAARQLRLATARRSRSAWPPPTASPPRCWPRPARVPHSSGSPADRPASRTPSAPPGPSAGGAAPAIEENWIKAYPCCLQTHGAIEAALSVRERTGGAPAEGATGSRSRCTGSPSRPRRCGSAGDGLEAKFSIPYLTAFALLHGAPAPSDFAGVDEAAATLAERITVRADAGLDESEAVLLSGGRELARVRAARGSPSRPLDAAALAAKRRSLAGERLEGALEDPARRPHELLKAAGLA